MSSLLALMVAALSPTNSMMFLQPRFLFISRHYSWTFFSTESLIGIQRWSVKA